MSFKRPLTAQERHELIEEIHALQRRQAVHREQTIRAIEEERRWRLEMEARRRPLFGIGFRSLGPS